jgi:hypothetical protein
MIPDIAVMLSAYIGFRMIEVFLLSPSRYSSAGAKIAACVLAVIAFLVTAFVTIDVVMHGNQGLH